MPITLYVRSVSSAPAERSEIRVTQQVIPCRALGVRMVEVDLDSRVYEPDSARLLHKLLSLSDARRSQIEVVDLGTFGGWFKGWQVGVRSAPTVVKDGVQYCGVVEAEQAVDG